MEDMVKRNHMQNILKSSSRVVYLRDLNGPDFTPQDAESNRIEPEKTSGTPGVS